MCEVCEKHFKTIGYEEFFSFIMICLYILGVIGGLGWTLYSGGYVIAAGVVAVAYMAWPKWWSIITI